MPLTPRPAPLPAPAVCLAVALRAAVRLTANRARAAEGWRREVTVRALSKFSAPVVAGAALAAATLAALAVEPLSPLTPPQERTTFQLADPNLTVELVASEPDIVAPVA